MHHNNILDKLWYSIFAIFATASSKSAKFQVLPQINQQTSPWLSPLVCSQSSHPLLCWSELRNFFSHPNPLLITSKEADETPEQTLHTSCLYTRVMSDEGPLNFRVVSDLFLLDWQCSYTPFVVLKSTNYLIIRPAVIVINAAVKGQMMCFDMSWWKRREFLWDWLSGSCLDDEGLLEGLG